MFKASTEIGLPPQFNVLTWAELRIWQTLKRILQRETIQEKGENARKEDRRKETMKEIEREEEMKPRKN